MPKDIPRLGFLAARTIAIRLFQTNIRWRKIKDVAFALGDVLQQWRLAPNIRDTIRSGIANVLYEVRRWDEKHREMFVETPKRRRAMDRGEHLRTFYNFLFACLYALREWVEDDVRFDKYRRATFKKQLADHHVYDFWLTLLESNWEIFFDTETRIANQKLQLCFQFAIRHGYFQLVQFIWNKIGDATKEYIGFLQWRSLCFRSRDRDTMKFICEKLCHMNPVSMARISFTMFWSTFYDMLNNEQSDVVVQEKFKHKFIFLLDNCCPELRRRLLSMENFRVISEAFHYNRPDAFSILLSHLEGEQLRQATEVVDRIHGRRQTVEGSYLRRAMLRKQATTAD